MGGAKEKTSEEERAGVKRRRRVPAEITTSLVHHALRGGNGAESRVGTVGDETY